MSVSFSPSGRHARIVAELADIGLSVLGRLEERLQRADSDAAVLKLAAAFEQVSAEVRRLIALEAEIALERRRRGARGAARARALRERVGQTLN